MTKGQRIKSQRECLGISQTELANKIGVSKQTLYKYENDIVTNIPSDVIERLSHCLEVSPAYIMGWNDFVNIDLVLDTEMGEIQIETGKKLIEQEKNRYYQYLNLFNELSVDNQNQVLRYMEFLKREADK